MKRHDIGFLEVEPKPTPQELEMHYKERYFQESRSTYRARYSDLEKSIFSTRVELQIAAAKLEISALSGMEILDLGCGEGWATKYFAEKGARVAAVDFSMDGIRRHNPDLLPCFHQADIFEFLETGDIEYDLVWMDHILEHVLEPVRLMQLAEKRLKVGGKFFVKVPNDGSEFQHHLLRSGKVHTDWWVAPPEHLSYFTLGSLLSLGKKAGFSVVAKIASFPVDWFLANQAANYVARPDLGKSAHEARLFIEEFIANQPLEKQVGFYSSMAELGLGRDITVVFTR